MSDAGIEAILHGGPYHGRRMELPPEAWQFGSFLAVELIGREDHAEEDESVVRTRKVRYTRVHGRPYDFEYVGAL